MAWLNVRALTFSRRAQGIYIPSFVFSLVWGGLCLPYYASHSDYLSMLGAVIRDCANVSWLVLWWRYRDNLPRTKGAR